MEHDLYYVFPLWSGVGDWAKGLSKDEWLQRVWGTVLWEWALFDRFFDEDSLFRDDPAIFSQLGCVSFGEMNQL